LFCACRLLPLGGIEKLLTPLGSAKFAMSYSVRKATFPEGGNSLVAAHSPDDYGSQEGAAYLFNASCL